MKSKEYALKSDLSVDKFEKRLREMILPDKAFQVITTYDFSVKPFCGKFEGNTFLLTKNTFWRHLKSIKIKGTYTDNNGFETMVNYSLGPSKLHIILFYLIFAVVIIGLNLILVVNNVRNQDIYWVLNGWIAFMYFFALLFSLISRFIVNQKFKTIFEIDVKPTDMYGFGGNI